MRRAAPLCLSEWISALGYFWNYLEIQQKSGSSRFSPQIEIATIASFVFFDFLLNKCYHNLFGIAREWEVGADQAQLTAALSRIPPFYIHERLDKHLCK